MKRKFTIVMMTVLVMLMAGGNIIGQPNAKSTCCDLKSDMRKLWEDHIIWTRNVIFNIIDELPGTTEAVNRLLQNQDEIGNAIKPFYGVAAGNQLSTLLREHINIAADLLIALKTDNTTAFNDANARWIANADAIAAFLSAANPNWALGEMKMMMYDHLNLTATEALARKNANYAADVIAFDNVHVQILNMADMLTAGIIKQFPNMFKGCGGEKNIQSAEHSGSGVRLDQNAPNPFPDQTVISYFIPDEVGQAKIIINDAMGNTIKSFDIRTKGEGRLLFNASNLRKGIYVYSIIADGKTIDTKKMIH
ncbi:MAG TPA: T9SS type A sorting domain-containing protein [Chitinophagaceae bacterium]|nr:T9SS type A sorting domain-containing protein [Chitinophagaceae bacterium]